MAGVVLEDGMTIAVQRQGNAPALNQALQCPASTIFAG